MFMKLLYLVGLFVPGWTLYFPQPDLNVTCSLPTVQDVYYAGAILDPDDSGDVSYSISTQGASSHCPSLTIDASGHIRLKKNEKLNSGLGAEWTCNFVVSASLEGRVGLRNVPKEELCFGASQRFEINVMENSDEVVVGLLGPQSMTCGNWRTMYTVLSEEDAVFVGEGIPGFSAFGLRVKAELDRESKDLYTFNTTCELVEEGTGKSQKLFRPGTLQVLDQNDNPPMTQEGKQHVTVYISMLKAKNRFIPGQRLIQDSPDSLFFRDSDTKAVNSFQVSILNDTKGLLSIDVLNVLSVKLAPEAPAFSAIMFQISLSSNESLSVMPAWNDLHCVQVSFKDTGLVEGHAHSEILYNICLHWGDFNLPTEMLETPEPTDLLTTGVFVGRVNRKTTTQAPVLYPFLQLVRDFSELSKVHNFEFQIGDFELHGHGNTSLDLGPEFKNSPFGVTPKSGIIYLADKRYLKHPSIQHVTLKLGWTLPPNTTFDEVHEDGQIPNVTIYLVGEVLEKELADCEEASCAEFVEIDKCESSCGFGSEGYCSWIPRQGPNTTFGETGAAEPRVYKSPSYATCTPFPICPDGTCDELEKLYPHLCPQDCAEDMTGFGSLMHRAHGRSHGISDGKGVCSCHDIRSCSCGEVNQGTIAFKSINSPKMKSAACDATCVLLLVLGIVFMGLTLIIGIAYVWRSRVTQRRKSKVVKRSSGLNGGQLGDSSGHTIVSELEYIGPQQNGLSTLPNGQTALANTDPELLLDAKWEIPRSALILGKVLGEGEFGKVLKGQLADNSRGSCRFVPVAVKILKDNHEHTGKSCRKEFMAEFSLLKLVDHPNVIKLLGACTATGGPLFLVMEFAEFGSLRSFLRKCRRVDGETDFSGATAPSTPDDVEQMNYTVSSQEILRFSWQIARGMAYLSDMKMVHRDLAARNILLTKMKVCKISDFGLTRDIYVDEAYQMKSKDRVPVKWLAPESLGDELYTTKSDVWSFGILLWELATLGASPYPGILAERLYQLLKSGHRMTQPPNCSVEFYGLMLQCWANYPQNRPTFTQLGSLISKQLEDGIEYLALDVPLVSNPGYELFSQTDHLLPSQIDNSEEDQETDLGEIDGSIRDPTNTMENLRLIDNEISCNDHYVSESLAPPTYVNTEPTVPDEQRSKSSYPTASVYESPIKTAK